jgi:hypothetical protein
VPYWLSFEIGQPMGLTQSNFAGETELWKSSRNRVSEVLYSQLREDIRISVSNLTEREGRLTGQHCQLQDQRDGPRALPRPVL